MPVPAQQILIGAAGSLSWQPQGADGEPSDPGTVTVTVTESDGTVVATDAATSGTGSTARTYTLAARTELDHLTATWKVSGVVKATTVVEIVGGYYFTIAEAVEQDEKLADRSRYPADRLLTVRRDVEAEFESVTEQAWVPRFARESVRGTRSTRIVVPHVELRSVRSIIEVDHDGVETPFDAGELAEVTVDAWGTLRRLEGWPEWRYIVSYEHGHDAPPPDLKAAAITRLRHRLNMARSGIPDRATSMSTEQGQTFSLATPGLRGFITGIPDGDVVLERRRFARIGVA
jgi:hypothetical protein